MHPHIASPPVATKDAPLGALRLLSIVDFTTSPRELSNFLNEILKLSGTNDGKAKLRSHPRMPQLLDFLIGRAEKSRVKNSRTVILAILSNLASNDSMRAVIGAYANGLIVSALGLDPSSTTNTAEDDDVAMHSTLYALRLMTRITVIARYELLRMLKSCGGAWAEKLVGFVRQLDVEDTDAECELDANLADKGKSPPLSSCVRRAIGLTAVRAIVMIVALPVAREFAEAIDPKDRLLVQLRRGAMKSLLDAHLVQVVVALVDQLAEALDANPTAPTAVKMEPFIILANIFKFCKATNLQHRIRALVEASIVDSGLLTSMLKVVDRAQEAATRCAVVEAFKTMAEHLDGELLRNKFFEPGARIVCKELNNNFAGSLEQQLRLYEIVYHLSYLWARERQWVETLVDAGGVQAITSRFNSIVDCMLSTDGKVTMNAKHLFVHTVQFALTLLRYMADLREEQSEAVFDAGLAATVLRLKTAFTGEDWYHKKLHHIVCNQIELIKMNHASLFLKKTLDVEEERNTTVRQKRKRRSEELHEARIVKCGKAVALPDRPENHCCPISQNVMVDPVVAEDGFTYERVHIDRWFLERKTSPMTNNVLKTTDVVPNHFARNCIDEWEDDMHKIAMSSHS